LAKTKTTFMKHMPRNNQQCTNRKYEIRPENYQKYYKLLQLNTMQRFMLAGFLCLGIQAASSKIKLPCDELGKAFLSNIRYSVNSFVLYIKEKKGFGNQRLNITNKLSSCFVHAAQL
jgi:hypothetical protein